VALACRGVADHVIKQQRKTGVKDAYTEHWLQKLLARARALKLSKGGELANAELKAWVADKGNQIYNPMLSLRGWFNCNLIYYYDAHVKTPGFDANQDTAVEILHTILLGPVKYVWHLTHTSLSDSDLSGFAARLQSSSLDGLSIDPVQAEYMIKFRNALVGKQFKQLLQLAIFHIITFVSSTTFDLWNALGFVAALVWFPSIENMDEYRVSLPTLLNLEL
jgi:hypothetical protein